MRPNQFPVEGREIPVLVTPASVLAYWFGESPATSAIDHERMSALGWISGTFGSAS